VNTLTQLTALNNTVTSALLFVVETVMYM